MRDDRAWIVAVICHGWVHVIVFEVLAGEQHVPRLWLFPLEEVELLVPMSPVEYNHRESKDKESTHTNDRSGDDPLVGCRGQSTGVRIA